jgi:hypothetical protein
MRHPTRDRLVRPIDVPAGREVSAFHKCGPVLVEVCPGANISICRVENPRPVALAQDDRMPRPPVIGGPRQRARCRTVSEDTANHALPYVGQVDKCYDDGRRIICERGNPGPEGGAQAFAPVSCDGDDDLQPLHYGARLLRSGTQNDDDWTASSCGESVDATMQPAVGQCLGRAHTASRAGCEQQPGRRPRGAVLDGTDGGGHHSSVSAHIVEAARLIALRIRQ